MTNIVTKKKITVIVQLYSSLEVFVTLSKNDGDCPW